MAWFILVLVAVSFIVLETILEKKTLTSARSFEFATLFAIANAVVLSPFVFKADFSTINLHVLGAIFLASLFASSATFLAFKTIKHNQLSEAAPILALLPLVVTIFAYFTLGEKIGASQLFGIVLIVLGMIFMELKNFKSAAGIFTKGREKYIYFVLLYLLLGGVSAIFDRKILHSYKINALTYLILIQYFIALNYCLFIIFKPAHCKELKKVAKEKWKIIAIISVFTVSHRYMYALAIQLAASMGIVVAVYKLSSLFQVLTGGRVFSENEMVRKSLASVIILSGVILLVLK